jgi:predicted anti-sigma-YlaC factor YlaD
VTARPYITCRELIGFIADYLDGALTEIETEDFQRHLSVCPSCRAYLETYRKTLRAEQSLRDDEPSDAPEELVQAILEIRRR